MVRLSHLLAMLMIPLALLVTACGGDNTDKEAERAQAVADSIARADSLQALQDSLAQLKMMNDSLQQAAEEASEQVPAIVAPSRTNSQPATSAQTEPKPKTAESTAGYGGEAGGTKPKDGSATPVTISKPKAGTTGVVKGGKEPATPAPSKPVKTTGVKKGGGGN